MNYAVLSMQQFFPSFYSHRVVIGFLSAYEIFICIVFYDLNCVKKKTIEIVKCCISILNKTILICQQEFQCIKAMHSFNSPIHLMRATHVMAKTVGIFLAKFWVSVIFGCWYFCLRYNLVRNPNIIACHEIDLSYICNSKSRKQGKEK